jgi:hypothetical protein
MKKPIFWSMKGDSAVAFITGINGPIQSPFCAPTMTR